MTVCKESFCKESFCRQVFYRESCWREPYFHEFRYRARSLVLAAIAKTGALKGPLSGACQITVMRR